MRTCLIVFTEPGHVFESVHRTIDGAAAAAAACGGARLPDGSPVTADGVAALLRAGATVSMTCLEHEEIDSVQIERHAILV